jgi:hypothetical protein
VPDNSERAREYRAVACELLAQAKNARFPELKAEFTLLAERYGRLADRLEGNPPLLDVDALADGILGIA